MSRGKSLFRSSRERTKKRLRSLGGTREFARANEKRKFDKRMFVLRFFAAFSAVYVLLHLWDPYELKVFVANLSSALLGATSHPHILANTFLLTGNASIEITAACTGLDSIAMLAGAAFAESRMRGKTKLLLLAAGAPILVLWNAVRVFLSLTIFPGNVQLAHALLWIFSAGIVLALWFLFLKLQSPNKTK